MPIKDYLIAKINCTALPVKSFDRVNEVMTEPAILILLIASVVIPLIVYLLIGIFSKQYIYGKKRRFITVKNYWYILTSYLIGMIIIMITIFPIHYLLFD